MNFWKTNERSKKGIWDISHNICCLVATRRGMFLLYCSPKENVHTRDQDGFWGSRETLSFPRGMAPAVGHKVIVVKSTKSLMSPLLLQCCLRRSQTTAPPGSGTGLKKQSLSPPVRAKAEISAGGGETGQIQTCTSSSETHTALGTDLK